MAVAGAHTAGCRQETWPGVRRAACSLIVVYPGLAPDVTAWALNNRGIMAAELSETRSAIADLQRAVALSPGNARYHNNLANTYRDARAWSAAERHYTRALENDSHYGRAYLNRGMVRNALGWNRAAREDLDKAVALQPLAGAPWTVRGNVRLAAGDIHGALSDQNMALKLAPKFGIALRNRACVHLTRGELARAALDRARAFCATVEVDTRHRGRSTCPFWRQFVRELSRLRRDSTGRVLRLQAPDMQTQQCVYRSPTAGPASGQTARAADPRRTRRLPSASAGRY